MIIQQLPYEIKNTTAYRGKVGLILLSSDFHTLYEFEPILQDSGILCFPARIESDVQINKDTLLLMRDKISDECQKILPKQDLDVVVFSCTAASIMIGNTIIHQIIQSSSPNRKIHYTTNPITALKKAIDKLNISEISIITPYIDDVNASLIEYIQSLGIHIEQVASFKVSSDNDIPHIDPQAIINATIQMAKHIKGRVIFISCTSLNICRHISYLEEITQKTIITSNQLMAWDVLSLCGDKRNIDNFGKLIDISR